MTLYIGDKQIAGLCKESSSPLGSIGQTILPIDESQGIYRYLNGQVISQVLFPEFTDKLKNAIQLYPIIACSEQEWQNIKTLSKRGQVGKFVIDDENKSIRLPLVINAEGLKELSNWGTILNESLPNVKGSFALAGGWCIDGRSEYAYGDVPTGVFTNNYSKNTHFSGGHVANNSATGEINFNAHNSSSTYQDDALVQEEAIQYPYYIKVGEEGATSVDITREIELNNPYSLLDSKYSDHKLNNLSWLLSNNQMNSGTVYVDAYNLLLKLYNGTETIEGITVKALGDSTITDYDFVIDTANTQFMLPLKNGQENRVDYNDRTVLKTSDDKSESEFTCPCDGIVYGYLDTIENGWERWITINDNYVHPRVENSPYEDAREPYTFPVKKGDRVWVRNDNRGQAIFSPALGTNYLYYYVGETVQNANLIDAGRIEETLATKEDIDTWVYYQNGTSGYRYNRRNGYCEQWGNLARGSETLVTVTMLKTFKDTNYNLQAQISNTSSTTSTASAVYKFVGGVDKISGNSFKLQRSDFARDWFASGYLASDQY